MSPSKISSKNPEIDVVTNIASEDCMALYNPKARKVAQYIVNARRGIGTRSSEATAPGTASYRNTSLKMYQAVQGKNRM